MEGEVLQNVRDRTAASVFIWKINKIQMRNNFKIHENMSCDVKNIIYVMKCGGCEEEYFGETGNLLRKRVTVHNQ